MFFNVQANTFRRLARRTLFNFNKTRNLRDRTVSL
nr:MAG TPA: hypothetical protein [Caudoviricetes sp.]